VSLRSSEARGGGERVGSFAAGSGVAGDYGSESPLVAVCDRASIYAR